MRILVTGAAGYIGAHLCRRLRLQRPDITITAIDRAPRQNNVGAFVQNLWTVDLAKTGWSGDYDAVVHLAAFISVEESARQPTRYYTNNLDSTINLLRGVTCRHFIFASTGTAFQPANPYAYSKVACEHVVRELARGHTIFRFYNVSGLSPGLKPTGQPTHLIRRAAMAAAGLIPELVVAGNDWDTRDGTCVRDYIHVEDLVGAIIAALEQGPANTPYECLGTKHGSTVLEVVDAMKRITGMDFRVTMGPRRAGDVGSMLCPVAYPHLTINHTLEDMCLSAYEGVRI